MLIQKDSQTVKRNAILSKLLIAIGERESSGQARVKKSPGGGAELRERALLDLVLGPPRELAERGLGLPVDRK